MNSLRLLVVILPVLCIACRDSASLKEPMADVATTAQNTPPEDKSETGNYASDTVAYRDNKQQLPQQTPAAPAPNPDWDKKIIKNASVKVEVKDYKQFNEFVHTTARKWGGYIAQEQQEESEYKIENTITIKVPVDQFDNAVNELVPSKEKVLTKNITSQDVTGEVVDVRSRMAAKQQVRLRYLDLLKQAKNMDEILRVQDVINDIQVEIESAAGRVNYLTHASALSTIQLTFFQVLNEQAEQTNKPNFGTRVLSALSGGMEWIGEMLIMLLTLWPLWVILGGTWLGLRKWYRAAKAKGKGVTP